MITTKTKYVSEEINKLSEENIWSHQTVVSRVGYKIYPPVSSSTYTSHYQSWLTKHSHKAHTSQTCYILYCIIL